MLQRCYYIFVTFGVTMSGVWENLVNVGLTENEAKVVECLINKGVASASDIYRESRVPRNKVYEILEKLSKSGYVEIQPGRPVLFKLNNMERILSLIVEEKKRSVEKIIDFIKSGNQEDTETSDPWAWIVHGRGAVRIKLIDLAKYASSSIFMIGGYPNSYIEHMASIMKNSARPGINTRLICMVNPFQEPPESRERSKMVEYRTVRLKAAQSGSLDKYDAKIIDGFRQISGQGCAVVIDEKLSFNIVDKSEDQSKATAILLKFPGVPIIQKGTIERIMSIATRRC
jgi:sugar-specific transcriptional regulator TrmB